MVATGYLRGHKVFYVDNEWRYSDGTIADKDAACAQCGQPPTSEGYDACLGHIPGAIGACCGHGREAVHIKWPD